MEKKALKVLCIEGYELLPSSDLANTFKAEDMKLVKNDEYNQKMPDLFNVPYNKSKKMSTSEVEKFCQELQKDLEKQNLSVTNHTFIDLLSSTSVNTNSVLLNSNSYCSIKELIYYLNKVCGATKFNMHMFDLYGSESKQQSIEQDLYNELPAFKMPVGISISRNIEQNPPWYTSISPSHDQYIGSLHSLMTRHEENSNKDSSGIVRFAKGMVYNHKSSYFETTESGFMKYEASNLFTKENIQNLINLDKKTSSLNWKSIGENYLIQERQKLIEAYKANTKHDNLNEKDDILEELEALNNIELTVEEYKNIISNRLFVEVDEFLLNQLDEELIKDFSQLIGSAPINTKSIESTINKFVQDNLLKDFRINEFYNKTINKIENNYLDVNENLKIIDRAFVSRNLSDDLIKYMVKYLIDHNLAAKYLRYEDKPDPQTKSAHIYYDNITDKGIEELTKLGIDQLKLTNWRPGLKEMSVKELNIITKNLENLKSLSLMGITVPIGAEESLNELSKLTTVYFDKSNDKLIKYIIKIAPNLEKITLSGFKKIDVEELRKDLPDMLHLKTLEIFNHGENNNITKEIAKKAPELQNLTLCDTITNEDLVEILLTLPKLEVLELSNCYNIGGEEFAKVTETMLGIEALKITSCPGITNKELVDGLKHMSSLKVLELERCSNMTGEGLKEAMENMPNLEQIKFTGDGLSLEGEKLIDGTVMWNGIPQESRVTYSSDTKGDESLNIDDDHNSALSNVSRIKDSIDDKQDDGYAYDDEPGDDEVGLFTIENITKLVNEAKKDLENFKLQEAIENYSNKRFEDNEEFTWYVKDNVIKSFNTDIKLMEANKDIIVEFIKLLYNQGIDLTKHIHIDLSCNEGTIGLINELVRVAFDEEKSENNLNILHICSDPEIQDTLSHIKNIKLIDPKDYLQSVKNTSNETPTLMNELQVQEFCSKIKNSLTEKELNSIKENFVDLSGKGEMDNGTHIMSLDTNIKCKTIDMISCMNETLGATKFTLFMDYATKVNQHIVTSGSTLPVGISVASYNEGESTSVKHLIEPSTDRVTVLASEFLIPYSYNELEPTSVNEVREDAANHINFPGKMPGLFRFGIDSNLNYAAPRYTEVTDTGYIDYKSKALFSINKIIKWEENFKQDNYGEYNLEFFENIAHKHISNTTEKLVEFINSNPSIKIYEEKVIKYLQYIKGGVKDSEENMTVESLYNMPLDVMGRHCYYDDDEEGYYTWNETVLPGYLKYVINEKIKSQELSPEQNAAVKKYVSLFELRYNCDMKYDEESDTNDDESFISSPLYTVLHPEEYHTLEEKNHIDDILVEGDENVKGHDDIIM